MLPTKLKNDSIIEAVCQLQFETTDVSEIVIGRLSDADLWSEYSTQRLPVSDIPALVRKADNNLRFAPLIQKRNPKGTRLTQIGDNVFSFHSVGEYCGWKDFEPELIDAIKFLFSKIDNLKIKRIGLRYINALTNDLHFIDNAHSLKLNITVAEKK